MTSKNPESKGQKGNKEERVSINSLDQLKRELKSENLDTSKDEYFKEKQININIAKSELTKLGEEIKLAGDDQEKILNILKQFITKKEQVIEKSKQDRASLDTEVGQINKLPPQMALLLKNLETKAKEPLSPSMLSNIIKELPKDDPIGRSFVMQFMIGRIIDEGYKLALTKNGITLTGKNEESQKQSIALQDTINNHINSKAISITDIEQSLIIGSGSLGEYRDTFGGNIPKETNNEGYIKYLMKKNSIPENAKVQDIESNQSLKSNEKALLISYISGGISNNKLEPILTNYEAMEKQVKEVTDSPIYKTIKDSLNSKSGHNNSTNNSGEIVKGITENPAILLNKPVTMLAAGIASIFALGYSKGSGFDFWTGLKRGFLAFIGIIMGNAVAKEWGIKPKELLKEGMELMKDGGNAAADIAKKGKDKVNGAVNGGDKNDKEDKKENKESKLELSPSQDLATKDVLKNTELSQSIEEHAKKIDQVENGKIGDYLEFINSEEFQGKTLDKIIYTKEKDQSIFYDTKVLDISINRPNKLNPILLKKVLRQYITGSSELSLPEKEKKAGDKEYTHFTNKYSVATHKEKTLKEFIYDKSK